jgi:hypothetical protein
MHTYNSVVCVSAGLTCATPSMYALVSLAVSPSLRRRDLWGCNVSGTVPASLSALTGLTYLALGNNRLSRAVPASLSALKRLTSLCATRTPPPHTHTVGAVGATGVRCSDLSYNQLSGEIPSSLSLLTALVFL